MKEMNSLTHSCMHSFASFAIFAFSGSAVFMIRATGAKFRMLASETTFLDPPPLEDAGRGDGEDDGDAEDMISFPLVATVVCDLICFSHTPASAHFFPQAKTRFDNSDDRNARLKKGKGEQEKWNCGCGSFETASQWHSFAMQVDF